jgi:hypothetical protein
MVPCPVLSRPSKKQSSASFSQFEQRENVKFFQKLGQSAGETFQMTSTAKKPWAAVALPVWDANPSSATRRRFCSEDAEFETRSA